MEQNTEIPVSSVFIEDSSDGFTADQRIFWSGVRSRSIFARCLACFDKTPDAAYERYRGRGQRDESSWDQPTAADTTELCSRGAVAAVRSVGSGTVMSYVSTISNNRFLSSTEFTTAAS